jgi:Family of unknown function (DUF6390)
MTDRGMLFHARHAFMPNALGYCGPDGRDTILEHLRESKGGADLGRTLARFEAAYPFLGLIARENGRDVFDYSVPEAYWIGNGLLKGVSAEGFYRFHIRELQGKDHGAVRKVFKKLGAKALPHHTFYVMATYAGSTAAAGPDLGSEGERRVSELIDSCRVSLGLVRSVGREELTVSYRPVSAKGGRLGLGGPVLKKVKYDPSVKPFDSVRKGDAVSLHWNFACDVLTARQARNLTRYTSADVGAANAIIERREEG